jgi:predicted dehydrogenase
LPALHSGPREFLRETRCRFLFGRVHLEQALPVIAAHKPLFVDKPLAATLEDARAIAHGAQAAGVPWFSSSSLRFGEIATTMKVRGCHGRGNLRARAARAAPRLDLTWYAIHPIELLYALLGPGCETVARTYSENADVIVGHWKDGRLGTVRALRPYGQYGAVVFRPKAVVESKPQEAAATGHW